MLRVQTKPVWSKLADEKFLPDELRGCLPKGWQLSEHQVETFKYYKDPSVDVIFNIAMTGDGKSLAAYLPALVNGHHAFGMYPTIALSQDQERQIEHYGEAWGQVISYLSLWGAKITEIARQENFKERGEWLVAQFKNYGVILTNPDIFNLVMNYQYRTFIYSPIELPYSLAIGYNYFVFDEFHVFEMPQIVSALTAMLWLLEHNPSQSPKFIFSSATPDPLLVEMMEQAGLRYVVISKGLDKG